MNWVDTAQTIPWAVVWLFGGWLPRNFDDLGSCLGYPSLHGELTFICFKFPLNGIGGYEGFFSSLLKKFGNIF